VEQKLQEIFNHYNKKYRLNLKLILNPFTKIGGGAYFTGMTKTITIHLQRLLTYYHNSPTFRKRIGKIDVNILPIFALLHEFKHAIEHCKDADEYDYKYFSFTGNYHKNPAELEADAFARKELNKWI